MQVPSCAEGLFPAVGMHSMGEEVKVDLRAEWFLEQDDGVMMVDSHEDDWGRLYDVRASGTVRPVCFTLARSRVANAVQTLIPVGNSRGRSVIGGGEGRAVFSSSLLSLPTLSSGLLVSSPSPVSPLTASTVCPPPFAPPFRTLLLLLFSQRVGNCSIVISSLGNMVESCDVSSPLFLQSSK